MSPTRRAFLQALGASIVARGWTACSSGSGGGGGPSPDSGLGMDGNGAGDLPWSVWRAMRDAVRTSPDSLGDRAAALVAAKDAQGLFALVRDDIGTLPTIVDTTERSTRWGPAATLRGGAGSPRDRADLLASLLQQAGFQATVVSGAPTSDISNHLDSVYLRDISLPFSPSAPPAQLGSSWTTALGGSDSMPPPKTLDPQGTQAKALFDAINAVLPANASGFPGPYTMFNVPLVALQQGGSTVYLNPLLPNAVFGQPYATQITAAPVADPVPTIELTLLFARASDPETQIPLISQTYGIDQLIGRQVVVATQPGGSIEDLIVSPLSSLVAFVPSLSVGGADLSSSQRASMTTTGPWLTQGGDLFTTASDGTVSVNGTPLGKGMGTSPTGVASVQVTQINAGSFPQIELTVSALDGAGKPVIGLGASAFAVSEDAAPVPFVLRDNGVRGPRVLFLIDTTGSQPAIPSTWANAVAQALFTAAPDATVQVVTFDSQMAADSGYVITNATALSSALTSIVTGGVLTPMWASLLASEATAPTLIVLMNDGDSTDAANVKSLALRALAGGAPVLAVTNYIGQPVSVAAMQAVATASGGVEVDAGNLGNPSIVTTPLSKMLTARTAAPYRLSYTAPSQGPSTRTVTVTAKASGTGTYTVPAMPLPGGAVVGLYLQVTLQHAPTTYTESYTRILGGHVPGTDLTATGALAAAVADARAALLGAALISFEGSAPTLSSWLADTITWRVDTENAANAFRAGDAKGGFSALAGVPTTFPRETMALHPAPLASSASNALVCEQWLRAVLFCVRAKDPPFHADILPFTRFTTAGPSPTPDAFFRATLLSSLRLAVAESAAFRTTTVSLLQGKALTNVGAGTVSASQLPMFPASQVPGLAFAMNQYQDWFKFVASDGSTNAFWAVHTATGSCLGVLPDGSGGGDDPCNSFNNLSNALDLLGLLGDILGCPFLSVWAELGKLVALAGVETIMCFNGQPPTVTPGGQIGSIGCSFGKGLLGGFPLNEHLGVTGVSTIGVNLVGGAGIDNAGNFVGCPPGPCGG